MATIDDLSEDILLHVLSFLPTLDAIRTCLISRKWRNLWHSLSSLNFDSTLFPPSDSLPQSRESFAYFVNQTLARRSPSPLHTFALRFFFTEDPHYDDVESWIGYAVDSGVVELDLDFYGYTNHCEMNEDCFFDLPISELRDSRVRVLKLRSCAFILPDNIPTTRVVSLRSMFLSEVHLTDGIVSGLISVCVNLESLVVVDCYGMEDLKICASKLKELSLWNFEDPDKLNSVEICAPNLCSLSIICFQMRKLSLEFSSSLVQADVEFSYRKKQFKYWSKVVRFLTGVERLRVRNWWFEFLAMLHKLKSLWQKPHWTTHCEILKLLQTKDVLPEGFIFNKLIRLELQTSYTKNDLLGLAAFLERSPNLLTLIMDHHGETNEDESLPDELLSSGINFSLPSLRKLAFKNFRATDNELVFLVLLKNHGMVIEEVVVELIG